MNRTGKTKGEKTKLLFVCLGNICRSPAAHAVMESLAEQRGVAHRFEIDSAGIGAWHTGQLPDRRMREHGSRRGYEFTHRARQVKREDFDRFDYVVGMDEENLHDLRRLHQPLDRTKDPEHWAEVKSLPADSPRFMLPIPEVEMLYNHALTPADQNEYWRK